MRSPDVAPARSRVGTVVVLGLWMIPSTPSGDVLRIVLGLWMIPSTPSGDVLRIVLGWVVVAVLLTAVHLLVTAVAPFVRTAARRDPSARLR